MAAMRSERVLGPDAISGMEPGVGSSHVGRRVTHGQHRIGLPIRVEQHQRGQQLGQRRWSAMFIEVAPPQ